MERLTVKLPNGYFFKLPNVKDEKAQDDYVNKLAEKIGAYEDAEEQGLLLRLPCKVGDTVYLIAHITCENRKKPLKCVIDEFTIDNSNCYAVLNASAMYYAMRRFKAINIREFGLTIFLTQEEAEKALADMGV